MSVVEPAVDAEPPVIYRGTHKIEAPFSEQEGPSCGRVIGRDAEFA